MERITPNLWFDGNALEAAEFYVSVFPRSSIDRVAMATAANPEQEGQVLYVEFTLDGVPFAGINGGPHFRFDEAVSFAVPCQDQAESDHYWDALLAGGGEESQCGWLKDRFGLSWQVYPSQLNDLTFDADPVRAEAATKAMYGMKRIDLAAVQAAADAAAAAA